MKRLKRYKKNVAAVLFAMAIVATSVFSTSFVSDATGVQSFYIKGAEPAVSPNQGYIVLLFKNNDAGYYTPFVYAWNTYALHNGVEVPSYAYITLQSNSFIFNVGGYGNDNTQAYYSLYRINSAGQFLWLKASSSESYTFTYTGNTLVGYRWYGNVGNLNTSTGVTTNEVFNVFFDDNGASALLTQLMTTLSTIRQIDDQIFSKVHDILGNVDDVEEQLTQVINYLKSVDEELDSIKSELQKIYDKADEILNEQKKQTSWLERIWNSIQEFINPSEADRNKDEAFQEESSAQKNEIDSLNEQNQTNKVDVGSASSQVDSNINYHSMGQYGAVLASVTNNNYVLQILLVVVSVSVIAYVLFGKR